MTAAQKVKRAELERRYRAPRRGIESSFTEALESVSMIEREKSRVFGASAFLSREVLPLWSRKLWERRYPTPLKEGPEYFPAFALG